MFNRDNVIFGAYFILLFLMGVKAKLSPLVLCSLMNLL